MTEKDYDLIAACIGGAQANTEDKEIERNRAISDLSERLVLESELENPRFNQKVFWERVEYWRKSHTNEN